ncbi:hypothetical protein [Amycolatopsis jejuensis]|nr:hypothetical protein [Amycolatopsis jejuensis]
MSDDEEFVRNAGNAVSKWDNKGELAGSPVRTCKAEDGEIVSNVPV